MHQDSNNIQVIELTKEIQNGVRFDSEAVTLFGIYKDELSLFRAKKSWTEILESNFLLEPSYDYTLNKIARLSENSFILQCSFLTACGRYAFWRLTNDQAPEAQYLIETAHIPSSDFASDMFISAPDLTPLYQQDSPPKESYDCESEIKESIVVIDKLKNMFENITKLFKV